ncbi:MAG: polysaccharide deacetylase family protein [Pseudobacteriovorax sp.]|nr:polysaccharide deacetylase family protein [Pseudobacteriovorax sp.]
MKYVLVVLLLLHVIPETYAMSCEENLQICVEGGGGNACYRKFDCDQNTDPSDNDHFPVILGLHEVLPFNDGNQLTVSSKQLEKLICRIIANDFDIVSLSEAIDMPRENQVVLTFDDGYIGNYRYAFPVLQRYLAPATFFIHPSTIGSKLGAYRKMTRQMLSSVYASGLVSLGSHSWTHQDLRTVRKKQLLIDFSESNELLKSITGGDIRFIAYPGGYSDRVVWNAARSSGYTHGFSYGSAFSSRENPFARPRAYVDNRNIDILFPLASQTCNW